MATTLLGILTQTSMHKKTAILLSTVVKTSTLLLHGSQSVSQY